MAEARFNDIFSEISNFKILDNNNLTGYVDTEEVYQAFLTKLKAAGFDFFIRSSNENYSDPTSGKRIFFESHRGKEGIINFFGYPFVIEKSMTLNCSLGQDYHSAKSGASLAEFDDQPSVKKKRVRLKTKKIGCPAKILVRKVKVFADKKYCLKQNTKDDWRCKAKVTEALKLNLKSGDEAVHSFERYYIEATPASCHTHEIMASAVVQRIHPELVKEIYRLVKLGICSLQLLKVSLSEWVKENIGGFTPDCMNSAFHPSNKTIYNHMREALYHSGRTKIDQGTFALAVEEWKKQLSCDNIYFRPCEHVLGPEEKQQTLLFCYQAEWQQHLLQRYGDMCVLDATYKTTKYSWPLYFITVKTNIEFIIVGIFIIQMESEALIEEAILKFVEWNPYWSPKYMITDYCKAERIAIESVFPGCTVYICSFHREQAWNRWLKKSGNVVGGDSCQEDIFNLWRTIADSTTEIDYADNVLCWKNHELCKANPKAVKYFSKQWLVVADRWVEAFHHEDFSMAIKINNCAGSQNKVLDYSYLLHNSDMSLTGILRVVIHEHLVECFRKYCRKNAEMCTEFRKINADLPMFLHDRPDDYLVHVYERYAKAKVEFSEEKIIVLSEGLFGVLSSKNPEKHYIVNFYNGKCSCFDNIKWRMPCKHFCSIFIYKDGWSHDKLPQELIENPYITRDTMYGDSQEALLAESLATPSVDSSAQLDVMEMIYEDAKVPPQYLITQSYLALDPLYCGPQEALPSEILATPSSNSSTALGVVDDTNTVSDNVDNSGVQTTVSTVPSTSLMKLQAEAQEALAVLWDKTHLHTDELVLRNLLNALQQRIEILSRHCSK